MAYNLPANQVSGTCHVMPGCDRISELPDSLLTHILSYLPTKHSVKTSALSTRWKNLWLSVPVLDLETLDFRYGEDEMVLSFIDRLLEYDTASRLLKVKVGSLFSGKTDGLKDRIGTVIKRGTQHLDVVSCFEYIDSDNEIYPCVEFMPLNLYTSRTLVSLKLRYSGVEDPGFVCMPCLKSMTLLQVHFRDDVSLEKLVSGCPVLEELTLMRDISSRFEGEVDKFMRVRSGSLKRFRVPWRGNTENSLVKCTLEIDAPGLEHLTLGGDLFDSIVLKNLTSLFMVDLDIDFVVNLHDIFFSEANSRRKNFGDFFLPGISNVRHMIISNKTVEALDHYSYEGLIPKFNKLSRLEAVFPKRFLRFLPAFLECCPNLKHLILHVVSAWEMEDVVELTNVPGCFLSSLECVQLKRIHGWEEQEMKVATYFLENAAVLKKLTLSLTNSLRRVPDEEIFEKVNKVTKCSPTCQILPD